MKSFIVCVILIFSFFVLKLDSVFAKSINDDISPNEEIINGTSSNIKSHEQTFDANKSDYDIFGDEQTFPFVAGLGKNAAH